MAGLHAGDLLMTNVSQERLKGFANAFDLRLTLTLSCAELAQVVCVAS